MGSNHLWTIMEQQVISAYDAGILDKKLLTVLLEPYRGTDIDSGGSYDLKTKDGLGAEEVILRVWGVEIPPKPADYATNDDASDAWSEAFGDLFNDLTRDTFGWR